MPTIPVDDDDHHMYYEDSGPPGDSIDYSTVLIVHGTAYHGAIFRRILPFAAQNNLRFILLNRRDYPGSSLYTDDDLRKVMPGGAAGAAQSFLCSRAQEFTACMEWLVDNENIPRASLDGKKGGITLLGWSAGIGYVIPVLSFVDQISARSREKLEPYFRRLVLFDCARFAIGPSKSSEGDDPLRDPSMTPEQKHEFFNTWVSGYYTHKSTTSRKMSDLVRLGYDASPPPTSKVLSAEELKSVADFAAMRRSEILVRGISAEVYAQNVKRALFDDERAKLWPNVVVDVVYCERSLWPSIDSVWWLQTFQEEAQKRGTRGREMRISMLPGANHFPHWDMPERTAVFLAEVIGA